MKKRILSLFLIATLCIGTLTGCSGSIIKSRTIAINEGSNKATNLYDGQFYVMTSKKNMKKSKNMADKKAGVTKYTPVYAGGTVGEKSESKTGSTSRIFYTTSDKEYKIPTLYKGDSLLYNSSESIPQDITFERMEDDGYSIGVYGAQTYGSTNLVCLSSISDTSGAIPLDEATKSIATALSGDDASDYVYISKIGKKKITADDLTALGTIKNLNVNDPVNVTYSIGTQQETKQAKANVHFWHCMEYFSGAEVTLINGNLSAITIPEYFKTGYYFVQGVGMFRYVNGTSWDEDTDFNEPIIILDEDGAIISDPSTQTEDDDEKKSSSNDSTKNNSTSYETKTISLEENKQINITASYLLSDEDGNASTKTPYMQISSDTLSEPIVKTLTSGETINYLCDETNMPAGTYTIEFFNFETCSDISISVDITDIAQE